MYLSEEQARDVISNAQNPHHQAFHGNNTEVKAAVEAAFERSHPGTHEVGGQGPLLDRLMNQAEAEQQAEQQASGAELSPEVQAAEDRTVAQLQSEWGQDYEGNAAAVGELVSKIPQQVLREIILDTGLHLNPELRVELSRSLLKLAKARRR